MYAGLRLLYFSSEPNLLLLCTKVSLSLVILVKLKLIPQLLFIWHLPRITFYYSFIFNLFMSLCFQSVTNYNCQCIQICLENLTFYISFVLLFLHLKKKSSLPALKKWTGKVFICLKLIPFSPFYKIVHQILLLYCFSGLLQKFSYALIIPAESLPRLLCCCCLTLYFCHFFQPLKP